MSNLETEPHETVLSHGQPCTSVEELSPRLVPLGGLRAMTVHRTLPQRNRSLVGAWCFLDHYGPEDVSETGGMSVSRHPHTGLATVSWLFAGGIHHLDSGGVAAEVRPGELNLMRAGRGITHQEISTPDTDVLHGVQLWYALPDANRFEENGFEHYVPAPVTVPGMTARVFLGELLGSTSPVVTRTTPLLGAELILEAGASVSLAVRRDFEHAVLAESEDIVVNGSPITHRSLGYIPTGAESLTITAGASSSRVLLLGGTPFSEQIIMWWNFVGRTHEEIVEFRRRYQAELGFEAEDPRDFESLPLFGGFPADQPAPIPAPVMPITTLRPRGGRANGKI